MRIALFHNPRAGSAALKITELVRQFENAGYDLLYKSIKEKHWEGAFREPIDRAIVAGGDGTVSRLAPWLAGRNTAFCILPLGTANNCARGLGQMHSIEAIITHLYSAPIRKIDLGVVTSSAGHRFFIESAGIGLLPLFMSEMRNLEKKKGSKMRLTPQDRLADAKKYLSLLAKEMPESKCEFLVDNEIVTGDFLLLEIANIGLIGPSLELAPAADPSDGYFDVILGKREQQKDWRNYLEWRSKGEKISPPFETRRCQRIVFRSPEVPVHVDGKVFLTMATPIGITIQTGALELVDFAK
jgi:diacylglycerol kinase (ATP)